MPIYQNSIIYKLCHQNDLENENIYVGSTTNVRRRKWDHKHNCNNEKARDYNFPVYQYIRAKGNWDEWQMIFIEKYPCNGKEELEIRERYYIELLKSKLNKNIPNRTQKEYRKINKEKIAKYKNQYGQEHKNEKKEYDKKYREDNKEEILEKKKQRYEKNYKQKVICDNCGCEITKHNLNHHKKTKKCINFVKKD